METNKTLFTIYFKENEALALLKEIEQITKNNKRNFFIKYPYFFEFYNTLNDAVNEEDCDF